ncbi:MAG: hypothetical protein K5766_04430 [Alphaproteobacteria bacterium]|nr:hypothetical protein [Alphaproteobacteria bacterium]
MKRVCTLIFGLTILGLTSSGANADSYYGNYDSIRPSDDYIDRDLDFLRYQIHNTYPIKNSDFYLGDQDQQREIERLRKIEEQKRLEDQKKYEDGAYNTYPVRNSDSYELYLRDQNQQREIERLRKIEEQRRLEEQRELDDLRRAHEQKLREEEAIKQEKLRKFEEYEAAQEQEKLRQMEIGKQFEIFLKSQEQNGLPLNPEQQIERKYQQIQLINSLDEKIRNEELRQLEEKEREQEKINRIVPLKWQAKRKVKFLVDQLSEINSRMQNLIQNVKDLGISNDPNLKFVQRSIEFCFKGMQNLLLNGIQKSLSLRRNLTTEL